MAITSQAPIGAEIVPPREHHNMLKYAAVGAVSLLLGGGAVALAARGSETEAAPSQPAAEASVMTTELASTTPEEIMTGNIKPGSTINSVPYFKVSTSSGETLFVPTLPALNESTNTIVNSFFELFSCTAATGSSECLSEIKGQANVATELNNTLEELEAGLQAQAERDLSSYQIYDLADNPAKFDAVRKGDSVGSQVQLSLVGGTVYMGSSYQLESMTLSLSENPVTGNPVVTDLDWQWSTR